MEPTFTELENTKVELTKEITYQNETFTSVTLKRLIKRPVMKRIVFLTEELDRVILYDGEVEFNAHKDDSEHVLIEALKTKIETNYSK